MAWAKPGQVQIRHSILDAEGLSSGVNPNEVSIQYEFMMVVISSLRTLVRTKWHQIVSPGMRGYIYYVVNHDFKVI